MAHDEGPDSVDRPLLVEELLRALHEGLDVDLQGADLQGAELRGAELVEINLRGANLKDANLQDAELQGADLQGADLQGADLQGASLERANLGGADLEGANLEGANLREARLEGANLWGAFLWGADLRDADLPDTNLRQADLWGANLRESDLRRANLREANLQGADLWSVGLEGADLRGADFRGARLRDARLLDALLEGANLQGADLHDADLAGANLAGAMLQNSNLQGVDLAGANLAGAMLSRARLYDLDLAPIVASSCVIGGNDISISAIARSLRTPGLHDFLVRCGQPVVVATYLIDSLRSLDVVDLFKMLQTVFISYGGPDTVFSNRLRDALEANGCKTWQFERDAVPGEKLHWIMHSRLREHDRTVLICSKKSLTRPGVLNEIEEALTLEAERGGAGVIIPITLDGYVFSDTFKADLETAVGPQRVGLVLRLLTRVVGDFRGARSNDDKFNEALRKLLLALRQPSVVL